MVREKSLIKTKTQKDSSRIKIFTVTYQLSNKIKGG
jgi:hypothetical protein